MHPQTAKYSAWIGVALFGIGFFLAIIGLAAKSVGIVLASYFLFGIGGLLLFLALIFSIIGIYESTHTISESDNTKNSELLYAVHKENEGGYYDEKGISLNSVDMQKIKNFFTKNRIKCNSCSAILDEKDAYKSSTGSIYCKCKNCKIDNFIGYDESLPD